MRVLVIEDDTTLGHALQEFLADQGYAVDWLTEGDRVLGALAGQPYDLMLRDLNLPGMSGLDVLRQLRQDLSLIHISRQANHHETDRRKKSAQEIPDRLFVRLHCRV